MCLEQFLLPLYSFARLCSVFFPNSGSFVNKKRHSNPLFFFLLPLFFFFICLVLADDAPSLAVYVPWLSLFTSLPPSVASWHRFFFFFSFLFSFVLLLASCGLVLGELPPQSFPSTELVSSSGCCPARMPLAALRPSARQEKPRVNTRIV